jgi:hypothetical protein
MADIRSIPAPEKEPCPWCESADHGYRACPRVRSIRFFGAVAGADDIEAIEFWPDDGFMVELPPDEGDSL